METTCNFERVVLRKLPYIFLKVKFEIFGAKRSLVLDAEQFKYVIVKALTELHGDFGAAIPVEVIDYQSESHEALLQVPSDGLVKVWSALTMYAKHGDKPCHFKVYKVSPHLPSMRVDSRTFMRELLKPKE